MREISFVKKLNLNFSGGVTKKALVIADADNDKRNELVCANLQGDLAVFKGSSCDRYAYATDLGLVTSCIVGDLINVKKNYIAAINTEGWLFLFHLIDRHDDTTKSDVSLDSSTPISGSFPKSSDTLDSPKAIKLNSFYQQRMPANCKELLLADLDGDGQNEVIIGLTDRVLRTYKWIKIADTDRGKFIGLYKWEFADQIGAVSLNPSRHDNCQDIIVAQPGGTYAKLECYEKKLPPNEDGQQLDQADEQNQGNNFFDDGSNVKTEIINKKLTPEYHQLALIQMRNHHISTEVLGGIRHGKNSDSYSLIVIATLDGTLMLVNKDEILWSLQVDHQLFALAKLEHMKIPKRARDMLSQSDSTNTIVPNSNVPDDDDDDGDENNRDKEDKRNERPNQYFIVCAWNGKTYIIDEERNYLRFKFEEAVSSFTAGNFYFDGREHPSLVYATFNNQIIVYYDVIIDHIKPIYLHNEVIDKSKNHELLGDVERLIEKLRLRGQETNVRDMLHDILYSIRD